VINEIAHGAKRFRRSRERVARRLVCRGGIVDRENRKQAVTDKLQDLPTVVADRLGLGFKQRVKYCDHSFARQTIRARREPAQIR
jgi:hypothetical protein